MALKYAQASKIGFHSTAPVSSPLNHTHGIVNLTGVWHLGSMKKPTFSYQRHRFLSEIISHAVWLYHRFCLSVREVEKLLAE